MIHSNNPSNNLSVLPFYLSEDGAAGAAWDSARSYAYGRVWPLFAQADMLLPFQFMIGGGGLSADDITDVTLRTPDGAAVMGITREIKEAGLSVLGFDSFDVVVYPASLPLPVNQLDGRYFLQMTIGGRVWYSDIMTAVRSTAPFVRLEWWDEEDMEFDAGRIVYNWGTGRFRNLVFLKTEIGRPDYTFEEEGEERDGYFFPEKQISEKTYRCTVLAPEYLCDALRLVRMADHVRITDTRGNVYDCDTFLMEVEWQEQGDLASVDIEFETDTVVKKIGRGVMLTDGGDFNGDFNGDFKNK